MASQDPTPLAPEGTCNRIFGLRIMRLNRETRAFYFDVLFRAPLFISIMFLSTVFLQFANKTAGCTKAGYDQLPGQTEEEADEVEVDCSGKAYGIRPSSVLTTLNSAAGIILAFLLPLIGSFVDHTDHRKACLCYASIVFLVSNFVQAFANESNWFFMVIVQGVFSSTSYMIHQTAVFAYSTEILEDNDRDLILMNSSVRVWELCTMLAFMICVTVIGVMGGLDEVGKSATSQTLACVCAAPALVVVWKNIGERPALSKVPAKATVFSAGFKKVGKTIMDLRQNNPHVLSYLRALLFFESANGSIIFASTTLITQQLKISDPSPILIVIIVITVFGAGLTPLMERKLGVKLGLIFIIGLNCLATLTSILFVNSPETADGVWIISVLYGIGIGATYPMQRTFYMLIIPSGQETEMMGLLQFCSIVMGWAPSTIFTAMNEHTNDLRLAMFSVLGFHVIGLLLLIPIDVKRAQEEAKKTEHLRFKGGEPGEPREIVDGGESVELVVRAVGERDIGA
eukprot:CAMPEP_0118650152 /NCGR_PEP_ID=MMETSP0785-20121206/10093_1 /TAXON_ID=91992 /ORGANISM="Bolidomonas pacifica, Strain CCMP 1866" /LENGTH=512 /DNA_ID=CAMNT_0006542505 /DNA_START=101 /DNA_END=1636 /DNA_ORIENTATION=+